MQYNTYRVYFKDFSNDECFEKIITSRTLHSCKCTLFEFIEQYEIKYHCICLDYQVKIGTEWYNHKIGSTKE